MPIVRLYNLTAAPGREADLLAALEALAAMLAGLEGCSGAEILRERDQPQHFVFLERWRSREAHERSAATLPASAFGAIKATLAGKPEAIWLESPTEERETSSG